MNIRQQEEKEKKLIEFRDLFREVKNTTNGIKELSIKLGNGFSSSTIQRYFHELYDRKLIDENEYEEIKNWLKENKEKGYSIGGKISQERYGFEKDELGHFKGGKRNG